MVVADLKCGQLVRARWGRAGRTRIAWCSWQEVRLHVQADKRGLPGIISLDGIEWAEYTPRDLNSHGQFQVEDYFLEIEGLTA